MKCQKDDLHALIVLLLPERKSKRLESKEELWKNLLLDFDQMTASGQLVHGWQTSLAKKYQISRTKYQES